MECKLSHFCGFSSKFIHEYQKIRLDSVELGLGRFEEPHEYGTMRTIVYLNFLVQEAAPEDPAQSELVCRSACSVHSVETWLAGSGTRPGNNRMH